MRINDRSKTDFDRAKIKLTGHFDPRPTGRYFEPWVYIKTKGEGIWLVKLEGQAVEGYIEWFFINNIIDITQKRNGCGLRSTMTQTRLNNFAIFNIHKLK